MNDDVLTFEQAASELGISVELLICHMIRDGLLIDGPNGLVASPHPDIVPLRNEAL